MDAVIRSLEIEAAPSRSGVHIRNLDAWYQGLPVGDAEGARSRRRVIVVHSRHVPELAAKRAAGSSGPVDALFGHSLYTGDAVVPRSAWQRRRGC